MHAGFSTHGLHRERAGISLSRLRLRRNSRRRKRAAWLVVIALLAITPSVLAQTAPSDKLGVVIGIEEDTWFVGDKPLHLWDPIKADIKATGTKHGVLVVWFGGRRPGSYPCNEPPCNNQSISPPTEGQGPPPPPFLERLWDKLRAHDNRYITAASRGLEGDLREAVVLLDGSKVDITSALRDFSPGVYWVRFEPVDHPTEARAPMQVQWASGKNAVISAAGLKAGLYRLAVVEESGEPTGSDAWILLSDREHYPAQSHAYQQTVDAVAAWPPEADPIVSRAVLRAALESLASQHNAPSKP
jgi:hypothetical protein